jgi:hypothetical protein
MHLFTGNPLTSPHAMLLNSRIIDHWSEVACSRGRCPLIHLLGLQTLTSACLQFFAYCLRRFSLLNLLCRCPC